MRNKFEKLALPALAAIHIASCQPAVQTSINNASSKRPKTIAELKEDILSRGKMQFYNNPEMACISGDDGIGFIRKYYRDLLKTWAKKFCPHKKHIHFTESTDRDENKAAQCVACED